MVHIHFQKGDHMKQANINEMFEFSEAQGLFLLLMSGGSQWYIKHTSEEPFLLKKNQIAEPLTALMLIWLLSI